MTAFCILCLDEFWKNLTTLMVGTLGFITAILTLLYSNYNNKRNYNFLLEKDKRDRLERLKKDELDFAKDKRERQRAYNRVLGSFLKLYHAYIQHKYLFKESGVSNIPDSYLIQIVDKLDNLNVEIDSFKKTANDEAAILPELTIYLHEILNLLGRFEMVTEQVQVGIPTEALPTAKLLFKRAHSYAVQELLDEYFIDLIDKIAIKADTSQEFLKEIKDFNSTETIERNFEMQNEIMKRYFESISRQSGQQIDLQSIFNQGEHGNS